MAGSYNRIVLVGNLTRDPEIRYVDGGGKAVTKFALAVNRKTKGGDDTMFIDIVAWDRLGEICNQYLKKGMSTLIEGRLAIRKYETKEGEKRTAVEVVASDMQMLDKRSANGDGGGSYSGGGSRAAVPAGGGADEDGPDDEIPF
ncbi:MAG: single-stranded DNA-binding protein [Candidatus Eremiobacteraeota bacterium]|nr:single-stranded DNA-binding protein [Candidatus Eremiobacteraeota bacterium]